MTGIERLREIAAMVPEPGKFAPTMKPHEAREVVAHIDAQDQRIQELEAALRLTGDKA